MCHECANYAVFQTVVGWSALNKKLNGPKLMIFMLNLTWSFFPPYPLTRHGQRFTGKGKLRRLKQTEEGRPETVL